MNRKYFYAISVLVVLLIGGIFLAYHQGEDHGLTVGFQAGFDEGEEMGYKTGSNDGFNRGFNKKFDDIYKIDSAFKDISGQFKPSVDKVAIVNSLAEITSDGPGRDSPGLEDNFKKINKQFISYLANTYYLSNQERELLLQRYDASHTDIYRASFEDFVDLNNETFIEDEEVLFTQNNFTSVSNFEGVLGKGACLAMGLFTGSVVDVPVNSLFLSVAKENFCETIATAAFLPLIEELKRQAIIKDYEQSTIRIKSQIQRLVAELATSEVKKQTTVEKDFVTKVDWLITTTTSWADVDIDATSVTKAGFKLQEYFELVFDHEHKVIEVHLGKPQILSHEVNYQARNLDDGWAVSIKPEMVNQVINEARDILYDHALNNSNLLDKSWENAQVVIKTIFQPIVLSTPEPYIVKLYADGYGEKVIFSPESQGIRKHLF
ncbi:MAG: hypothetical protein HEP71_15445 [Roseivirga sp.]|nr:hypothetical protein [Roseivirga sp.]